MWYTIQPGDSLSILAGRYLGSIMLFNDIYEQNRDVLNNPDIVVTGTRIWIPIDGKQNPNGVVKSNDTTSPYQSSFPNSGSQTVLSNISNSLANMDKNKMFIYGGAGLAAIGALLLLV